MVAGGGSCKGHPVLSERVQGACFRTGELGSRCHSGAAPATV